MLKKIGLGILAILVIIQFFRIDKENPEVIHDNDFLSQTQAPLEVQKIIRNACYDCHSNETKYPWYSNIAPISWWLKDHIDEGREHLNFSEWGTYKLKRKKHKLEECWEMVEEGEMPLESYLITHSEAELSSEDKQALVDWFKGLDVEPKEEAKKTLQLNNGEKWEANPETTEGIAKMKTIVIEEIEEGRTSHYAAMGERLNIEVKAIFSACSMKGEAHEQLHLYIMPLVDLCEQLEYVEDENTALILQKDILKRVNLYEEYFK